MKQEKLRIEEGEEMDIEIDYEWLPPICMQHYSFEHTERQCPTKES